MNIVLLSGGSGKRLWPLSNDIRSKQFIRIFRKENGDYESMVQRMYRYIKAVDQKSLVTVATSKSQVSSIKNQLGNDVDISIEPCRRDTFPAIALACSYLFYVKKMNAEEPIVVCPVDPYVEKDYFEMLNALSDQAAKGEANIVLMGIEPTYPSEKYGYIIPKTNKAVSLVKTFKEKPSMEDAKKYIEEGGLWNGGIFAFKLGYLMEVAHKLIDFVDYHDLYEKYENCQKISFDYAVLEKEESIQVIRFNGRWDDLGTWNNLTKVLDEPVIGKGMLDPTCKNTNIINELNIPVVGVGLNDVVISASPEGILVSDKEASSSIKPIVDPIKQNIMFSEKSWGTFKVIDSQKNSIIVIDELTAGKSMSYHSHKNRNEIWVVVSGEGTIVLDGESKEISGGDVVTIASGCKHKIFAKTNLKIVEIQMGLEDISSLDKEKYKLDE